MSSAVSETTRNDEQRTKNNAHVLLDACWSILVTKYGAWAEAAVPAETLERLALLPHALACRDAVKMLAITPELAARVCKFVMPVDKKEMQVLTIANAWIRKKEMQVLTLANASGYHEPRTKNQELGTE